jgi:hypothetical protein
MKLRTLVIAVFATLGASVASAASYDLGQLASGDNYLSTSEDEVVTVAKGSFTDIFNFSIGSLAGLDGSAGVLNFGKFKIDSVSFSYSLFSGTSTSALATGNDGVGFSMPSLGSGSYRLEVSGQAVGTNGGKYNGWLSVTPVPEPESYAMFLAGLGIMGAIARRRRIG